MCGWQGSLQVSVLEWLEWHERRCGRHGTSQWMAEGQGGNKGRYYRTTYVCMGRNGVVALDGIGLSASQDHRATHLGFRAIGYGCSFGRGLQLRIAHILQNVKNKVSFNSNETASIKI